jgi:hypothetical protein
MIRYLIVLALLAAPLPAWATTCSQANSECDAKSLNSVIVGPQQTGESAAKLLNNVIVNTANEAASKLLINVIVIPGTASTGVVPVSPLTHLR